MANPTHTTAEEHRVGGLCNGIRKPPCVICWPDGAPSRNDWIAFRKDAEIAFPDWKPLAEKQRIIKAALTDGDAERESKKTTTRRPAKKGLIRRFIRWIY